MRPFRALLIALVISVPVAAQNASAVFSKASRLYKARHYDSTITVIRHFLVNHGKDPGAEYLVPLIMEAMVRAREYESIGSLYDLYMKRFPHSAYLPRVLYLRGTALGEKGDAPGALAFYSRALHQGASPEIDSLVIAGTVAVCAKVRDTVALGELASRSGLHRTIRETVRHCLAERRSVTASRAHTSDRGEPKALAIPAGDGFTLGVLAPESGEYADVGKRVTQGVRLAIDEYNTHHRSEIRIVSADTRGSLVETARCMKQIIASGRIKAIIGPMLSGTATVAAGMLSDKPIVMVTPTATDDGIASLGSSTFQVNVSLGVLARSIARYAMENLNIREFVILAPRTAYGSAMRDAFREEVIENGGTVIDEESFDEGGNNYKSLFVKLRHNLLVHKLDLRAKEKGTARKDGTLSWADSARWADSAIPTGAIFIPAEPEEIAALAPQLSFHRIKGQLLGSNGWYSAKTIGDGGQYVENAVISAPFEPDSTWKHWSAFHKAYVSRFHEEPDRVAALGYDAATIVTSALGQDTAPEAGALAAHLGKVRKFEGASGLISFGHSDHANSEAAIYKITSGRFVRLR